MLFTTIGCLFVFTFYQDPAFTTIVGCFYQDPAFSCLYACTSSRSTFFVQKKLQFSLFEWPNSFKFDKKLCKKVIIFGVQKNDHYLDVEYIFIINLIGDIMQNIDKSAVGRSVRRPLRCMACEMRH